MAPSRAPTKLPRHCRRDLVTHPFKRNYRSDFDLTDPELSERWDEVVADLHAHCPVARSEVGEGYWVVHSYKDVAQCSKDWRTFSSADGFMVNRPEGMPYFPPAEVDPPVRRVKKDVEVHGVKMCAGDRVLLSYGAACRDPALWSEPNKVDLDRGATAHLAFGAGVHRCIEESLARVVLRAGYEEFLKRIPDFSVAPDFVPEYETGSTRHMVSLPLKFSASQPRGTSEGCPR